MTVRELIAELQKYPPEARVVVYGGPVEPLDEFVWTDVNEVAPAERIWEAKVFPEQPLVTRYEIGGPGSAVEVVSIW